MPSPESSAATPDSTSHQQRNRRPQTDAVSLVFCLITLATMIVPRLAAVARDVLESPNGDTGGTEVVRGITGGCLAFLFYHGFMIPIDDPRLVSDLWREWVGMLAQNALVLRCRLFCEHVDDTDLPNTVTNCRI